jgi:hypothetical protein
MRFFVRKFFEDFLRKTAFFHFAELINYFSGGINAEYSKDSGS